MIFEFKTFLNYLTRWMIYYHYDDALISKYSINQTFTFPYYSRNLRFIELLQMQKQTLLYKSFLLKCVAIFQNAFLRIRSPR